MKKDKKEQKLLEDINNYLIDLAFHVSHKMFSSAKRDVRHIKEDVKRLDKLEIQSRQLGLTKKEFLLTARIPHVYRSKKS